MIGAAVGVARARPNWPGLVAAFLAVALSACFIVYQVGLWPRGVWPNSLPPTTPSDPDQRYLSLGQWNGGKDPSSPEMRAASAEATQRQVQSEVKDARVWAMGDGNTTLVIGGVPGCTKDVLSKGFKVEMLRQIGFMLLQCGP